MSTLQLNTVSSSNNGGQWLANIEAEYVQHTNQLMKQLSSPSGMHEEVSVCGFPTKVVNTAKADALKTRLVKDAEKIRNVREKLNRIGLAPIAILPESIFSKIVEKAGFYSFYNINARGKVKGDGQSYLKAVHMETYRRQQVRNIISYYGTLLTIGVMLALVAFFANKDNLAGIIISTLYAVTSPFLQEKAHEKDFYWYFHPHLTLILFFWETEKMDKNYKNFLWPNRTDVDPICADEFDIVLPIAPVGVQEKLVKCHLGGIKTFLVVDEKAFDVKIDDEVVRQLDVRYDPIICTAQEGMVAVIDQFGDFEKEKEVIEYVIEHFNAVRKDIISLQAN